MADIFDLTGRKAIVTGGSKGIGAAIVRALDRAGATVAIADLDVMTAQSVVAELKNGGFAVEIDVTKRESVEHAFNLAVEGLGGFDLLCANAGVSTMKPAIDITDEEWDFNFDVNARGVFLANQIATRRWLAEGTKGVIVNTASLAAKVGAPLLAHYSASKFAVFGWTQSLARELAPKGIRVNCVCPGFVKTSMQEREIVWEAELRGMTPEAVRAEYVTMTPLGRIEEPEDVADVVVFLASDASRFMTGQGINITGGVRMD
ncbi:SDR family NAD(P)-dependent oxidoreductase [Kaistia dalseonensis]|uniref:NAD(P)-dependent dehydrogenase (Short-subunit alcohol dehydrogenase family) n=1 Tax=Kaistia dalseonensis TaxID=410840 RepID=A0ABU0HC06_9HYPH|nr:SDR family NAD(P)-dependent oxidoreductase [Kaistia dalseonensis]MCX5497206.1 SDR family NAD(P)-dependent oxidoreductase [Kaistia dalseonensis]MDQ0439837.1 NAD(P)-dependent dehydrogenase (short-subunit alcohol dehydrogenase family) [Kaistia dalseonensis]